MGEEAALETQETGGEQQSVETGSFYSGLSDESRKDPSAEKFMKADNDTAFRMYKDAQSAIGKDKLVLPNWGDSEDVGRFYTDLGVPNSPDKYELGEHEWATEAGYDNSVMKQIAHNNHLTSDQAKGCEKDWLENVKANQERGFKEAEEAKGKNDQLLRAEMGEKYEEKMAGKDAVIDKFARTPEAAQALKALADSNPLVAASIADIASKFSEHSIGDFQVKTFTISADEATDKAEAMRADMSGPYWNDSDRPAHEKAVADVLKWEEIAAGKGR